METLISLPPLLDNVIENAVIFLSAADKYYENRFGMILTQRAMNSMIGADWSWHVTKLG